MSIMLPLELAGGLVIGSQQNTPDPAGGAEGVELAHPNKPSGSNGKLMHCLQAVPSVVRNLLVSGTKG